MKRNVIYIVMYFILLIGLSFSQLDYRTTNLIQLTGEEYITGEDGVPRMSVNIWGHVKNPGTYLVYDAIDILTCLSMAGGPMKGAKLSKISIIAKDGTSKTINLTKSFKNNTLSSISLKPQDTIYIDETFGNYLLSRSNVINTLLQITNLLLITSNNK